MFKGFSIAKVSDKFKIPCLLLSLRLYSSIKKENIIFWKNERRKGFSDKRHENSIFWTLDPV